MIYLATPYTKYADGHEAAFVEACKAAATLMKRGLFVFSPIAHAHPIAAYGSIDNIDNEFWQHQCAPWLDRCDALIVLMMPGWHESDGVAAEIARAQTANKPVSYISWPLI